MFLSPVKEDEEEMVEDGEEDGEEDDEEDEEKEEVEDVMVDVSSPSFRFGRLLLTGTKLILALSWKWTIIIELVADENKQSFLSQNF